jgi:outer membrane autotransporter protein
MSLRKPVLSTLTLTLVAAGALPAFSDPPEPRWNMYKDGRSLEIHYTGGALNAVSGGVPHNHAARIDVEIAGKRIDGFTIDTGSTGIAISAALLPSLAGYKPLGNGTINYDSSGASPSGTFYELPVSMLGGTSGGNPARGSTTVKVLVVTNDANTRYFGIGNNRNNVYSGTINPALTFAQNVRQGYLTQVSAVGMNPLLNVAVNGTPLAHQGYVVMNDRIVIGLTAANNRYSFVQLTPDPANGPNLWNGIPVALRVGGGARGEGGILHDTGIDYAFLTPFGQDGQTVDVSMPGAAAAGAFYRFVIDRSNLSCATTAGNSMTPCHVAESTSKTPFLNTGRQFYAGFNYLFDPVNGFVGYALSDSGLTTTATLDPTLALIGTLALRDGFTTDFRTHLMGDTTLSQTGTGTFSGTISGPGGLTVSGGVVNLLSSNTFTGGLSIASGGTVRAGADTALGASSGDLVFAGGTLQATSAFTIDRTVTMGSGGGTFDTNGNDLVVGRAIGGSGSLTKTGLGMLTLSGANGYTGGTIVNEGTLRLAAGASLSPLGALVVNGGIFDLNGNNVSVGLLQGTGGTISLGANRLTVNEAASTTLVSVLTGSGGLSMEGPGTLNLAAVNTYTGPTTVSNGRLAVNGSITSDVTVGPGGTLGGIGTIFGSVTHRGMLAPGNSIGTLNIAGNLDQAAGSTYRVELANQGQADRTNVTGTAQLSGTVNFIADPGFYSAQQTYTILNAAGGVSGAFAAATGNYAFLFPSLSYDANNAYLTIARSFARGAQTPNQAAVGAVLDANAATATGSFGNAIAALTTLSPAAGTAALNALSGQNYSGFSSVGVASAQLFMSNFAGRAGGPTGGPTGGSNRVALAEACDVACDSVTPALWGAWGGAVGGLGTILGTTNAGTLTYNVGGFAAGIDRKLTPDFLIGVTVGYSGGTQWVQGFRGQGTTGTAQAGLYGSYARGPVYVDGLAAYAYSDNQMTRQIAVPGIAAATAQGRTGVNQVFGQVETGYRFDIGGLAQAFVTPFARLQGATATQNAFTETGAGALGLSVAAQTTNSLRTVFGAQLGGAMNLGWREKLAMQFRLGWGHEFADTARPVTASFIGAPASPFTTFGAAPQRDSVVLGLAASTALADATSAYFRYEGDVSSQTSNHALTAGVRMVW